jgi:hypothetical protein
MTRAPASLVAWQRRVLAAVAVGGSTGGGVSARKLVTPSRRQTSSERLAVYAGSHATRLVEILESDYPAVRAAIGDLAFRAFATRYVGRRPSRSWDLAAFSRGFAREFRLARWPAVICDLAAFERAVAEVFDGPGSEKDRPLRLPDLARLSPARAARIRLKPTPSLKLLALRYPMLEWHGALRSPRSQRVARPPDRRPAFIAVFRRDFVVMRREITKAQHALLGALARGASLAGAISAARRTGGLGDEELLTRLPAWFREWGADGIFGGYSSVK